MQYKRRLGAVVVCGLAVAALAVGGRAFESVNAQDAPGPAGYISPFDLAWSPDGASIAISDRTGGRLYLIDPARAAVGATVDLNGKPTGVAWLGATVLVAEYDAGTVAQVAADGTVGRRFKVGRKPVGIAVTPDGGTLVACNYGLNSVSIVDVATGEERRVPVLKHPYFVAVTPDGARAVVGNELPDTPASDPTGSAAVSIIDLAGGAETVHVRLPDGSSNVRQVAVSPDGNWAYVAHTRGRVVLPATQLDRGWVNTNAFSIIDLSKDELTVSLLLDYLVKGAADPWGMAVSPDGGTLFVSIAGAHQVARIGLAELHGLIDGSREPVGSTEAYVGGSGTLWKEAQADPAAMKGLVNYLNALYGEGLIQRVDVPVKVPRGIAVSPDGQSLAVAGYFSGEMLLLDPVTCAVRRRIPLGRQPAESVERRGERIFFDADYCFQSWLSCGTCHPDGRADGLNWDLLNDGVGNPKNTKSLLWSYKTPPVMSLGVRATMEVATAKGFQFIQFTEIDEGDMDAVRAYLRSMEPEASPYLVDGELSPRAVKGKALFEDDAVGCARCHPAPLYTNMKMYDVGTRSELDRADEFDTPTCVEMWRSGPYLHDGSATTMMEVLTTHNRDDRHGRTSHLDKEELEALAEFVLSL